MDNLHRILEAAGRTKRDRKLAPIERNLAKNMAQALRQQGRIFLRALDKTNLPRIAESAGDDWEQAWRETEKKTQTAMTTLLLQAARRSFAVGIDEALANIGISISFSVRSPEAIQFLRNYGAERVTMINDTTRGIIRDIIVRGLEQGIPYSDLADEISARFAEFAAPKPQRHLRNRAELVAVTETANAYGEAGRQTTQRIAALGISLEKSWLTTGDDRVSDGCRSNAAAGWIGLNTPFPSGHQREPRFPGCRCTVQYRRMRRD